MQNTAHRVFCHQYSLYAVNLEGKLAAERSAYYAVALAKLTPGIGDLLWCSSARVNAAVIEKVSHFMKSPVRSPVQPKFLSG
ncbi:MULTISPECIES: hypothetical protein [Serratia]|uniref:hypothetical protein n=1 Tax=Serratia TaxID=613 RepID=UPI0011126DEB|nr:MULTISPECIES: hypothetical protein [Serratia]